MKKLTLGIIVALCFLGIVGAGSLATKVITIDKGVIDSADTNNVNYNAFTYRTTSIDSNYNLICIYNSGKLAYPCSKVLATNTDAWIKIRIENLIKGAVTDKTKSTDEGIIQVEKGK